MSVRILTSPPHCHVWPCRERGQIRGQRGFLSPRSLNRIGLDCEWCPKTTTHLTLVHREDCDAAKLPVGVADAELLGGGGGGDPAVIAHQDPDVDIRIIPHLHIVFIIIIIIIIMILIIMTLTAVGSLSTAS